MGTSMSLAVPLPRIVTEFRRKVPSRVQFVEITLRGIVVDAVVDRATMTGSHMDIDPHIFEQN